MPDDDAMSDVVVQGTAVTTLSIQWSGAGSIRRRPLNPALIAVVFGVTVAIMGHLCWADNFANAYYDARKDQLVVTINYRGTNPDHIFSLQWGQCKEAAGGSTREIVAEVLDSQWQDAATRDFKKTTRFNLDGVQCRPAKLTLRTAPRFYFTLQIPARPST